MNADSLTKLPLVQQQKWIFIMFIKKKIIIIIFFFQELAVTHEWGGGDSVIPLSKAASA